MTKTLKLGCVDATAAPADPGGYTAAYHDWRQRPGSFRGEANNAWSKLRPVDGRPVAELQKNLRSLGFNPHTNADGVFGYRTLSAVRLFQEYVRTIGADSSIGKPDGIAGRKTLNTIGQWLATGTVADWTPEDDVHGQIIDGLNRLKQFFMSQSGDASIRALNQHAAESVSRRVEDWRFDPDDIHLIGVRRDDTRIVKRGNRFVRSNDDIFVLLVNGMRLVFRGSTDPSPSMAKRDDAAFLIRGQHEYRFGWHKLSTVGGSSDVKVYRAFKPRALPGPLVVRASGGQLLPSSYAAGATANYSINLHWSGSGTSNWSAGCQVIAGLKYKNFRNQIIEMRDIAAPSYGALGNKTRGAYNVLIDLITVFSRDCRCSSSEPVCYTLLYESDLSHAPGGSGIDFPALVRDLS